VLSFRRFPFRIGEGSSLPNAVANCKREKENGVKNILCAVVLFSTLSFAQTIKSNTTIAMPGLSCPNAQFVATGWSGGTLSVQGGAAVPLNLVVDKLFDRCSVSLFTVVGRHAKFLSLTSR